MGHLRFPHPSGNYTITYASGLTGQSLLENLPDNSRMAAVHFVAHLKPGATPASASTDLNLCSSTTRLLYFSALDGKPLNYALNAGWLNVWGKSSSLEWNYSFPVPSKSGM